MSLRIIPRLDIKGPNLVKGVNFEGLRVLGKPEFFARLYYEEGADELIFMDAVASLYGRNSLLPIVERTAQEIFIPLTVGGGLRTEDDIRAMLRAGADKVALNSAAIAEPELIRSAARRFGSSTIVVSIEASRHPDGTYECYTDYGRQGSGVDAVEWAQKAVELGAGEILLTSINQEGTGRGFDLELIERIARVVSVPLIVAGGAGNAQDLLSAIRAGGDAVALASVLHYEAVERETLHDGDFDVEGNTRFLEKSAMLTSAPSRIQALSLKALKTTLQQGGVAVRTL